MRLSCTKILFAQPKLSVKESADSSNVLRSQESGGGSQLGDDETHTAYDVVRWRFVRSEREKLDWECKGEWAEDESSVVEFDVTEDEASTTTNSVEGSLMGAVRRERIVMTIQYDDGSRNDHRLHGGGLLFVGAYSKEALPPCALQGWTGVVVLEPGHGDMNGFDDRSRPNLGFIHCGRRRYNGDGIDRIGRRRGRRRAELKGHYLIHGEVLRCEDAVKPVERQGTFSIEEIGDVGLTEARLPCQTGSGEGTEFNTAEEFETEEFVEILKIHKVEFSCCRSISSCKRTLGEIIALRNIILDILSTFCFFLQILVT